MDIDFCLNGNKLVLKKDAYYWIFEPKMSKKAKICLFLGAGFSKPFGLLTMREFLKGIFKSISSELADGYRLILAAKASTPDIWKKSRKGSSIGSDELDVISEKRI
ncbi:MAG: hypothetical protein ACTSV6_00225 [Candidatus Heimdallarchaeota archaeon]